MSERTMIVTLPADQQQIDHTGYVFTFRDEAPEPDRVWEGALIVAGDEDNPFVARVVEIVPKVGRELVHLEPLCVPEELIEELRHCGFVDLPSRRVGRYADDLGQLHTSHEHSTTKPDVRQTRAARRRSVELNELVTQSSG